MMKEGYLLDSTNNEIAEIEYKTKDSIGINIIGFILISMAGLIDTVGVGLFLNESSAFLTGRGSILGYWAYKLEFKIFISIVLVVISFIAGAWISTIIIKKAGLMGSLFFTGLLIILVSLPITLRYPTLCTIFVPMAMGCQNAATSLTKINRTTHLTGPATDIGINIAKGNWKVVKFWMFRWIGFPLGSVVGSKLVSLVNANVISVSIALVIPATVIILTGIIQKIVLDIPLLD